MKKLMILITLLCVHFTVSPHSVAMEKQIVAGAGPSTKIVGLFFQEFSELPAAKDYEFVIPPKSVKHAGGIKASDTYVFGRTGRPLNAAEKEMNKGEIFLAQIPVTFAVGDGVGIKSLERKQLEKIITGGCPNWKHVGGPDSEIVVVGREKTEAILTILKSKYPFFDSAVFSKTFRKDDHVVNFLKSPNGKCAIGFGAEPNFRDVEGINILPVKDFRAGVNVGLVYDLSNGDHPLVKAATEYAASEDWSKIVSEKGYLPPGS